MKADPIAALVFFVTLLLTFGAAIYARVKSKPGSSEEDLAGRNLNKWLVGLSAATTGNSGFIVTGAVGLGYSGGAQWLLLPLGWLIGDLVYWSLFPAKINRLAREAKATTLPELLTYDLHGRAAKAISVVAATILVVFLLVYTAAQWLAGEKFLSGAFDMSASTALLGFGLVIVLYSAIGGFRGSVYVDTLQAVIRIGGTILALAVVTASAREAGPAFWTNLDAAGPGFLNPLAGGGLLAATSFMLGYAGASIGFGLGQPQIITRYMAGESPEETQAARWIYIGFLQFTWVAMTVFGMLLRGVQPGIADPETGLSTFFLATVGPVATGIIFADVFATIAGTSNGLLIAISQTIRRDLLGNVLGDRKFSLWVMTTFTLMLGLLSIGLSLVLPGNVYSLAVGAISMIGAALAGAVIIKVFRWHHSAISLLSSIVAGFVAAASWHFWGPATAFNETAIGIAAALIVNFAFYWKRITFAQRASAHMDT
jgi:sodium/proline symporter